jgi:hypothetical protein
MRPLNDLDKTLLPLSITVIVMLINQHMVRNSDNPLLTRLSAATSHAHDNLIIAQDTAADAGSLSVCPLRVSSPACGSAAQLQ